MSRPVLDARLLAWLRAGCPQGIPATDYVAVLGVLRRQLTEDEIEDLAVHLADHLADQASAEASPVTAEDMAEMANDLVLRSASDDDVGRVSARPAGVCWPLSDAVG